MDTFLVDCCCTSTLAMDAYNRTMSKKLPYFQFEPAEYLASDISICSLEAQGLFILICAIYWQKDCVLKKDKFLKRYNNPDQFDELVEEGIIKVNKEGFIKIKFLQTQHHFITKRKEKYSEAGKKGAMKRTENQSVNKPPLSQALSDDSATLKHLDKIREDNINNITHDADASSDQSHLNKNPTGGEKEKEKSSAKKEKETFNWEELKNYFNKITGMNKRVVSKKVKGQLNARLKEGYTKQDISESIKNAAKDDFHIESGYKWLTLEYISRSDTIDKYSAVNKTQEQPTRMTHKFNT